MTRKKATKSEEHATLVFVWAAEALGELTGSRPYFMSFDEYKKQRADEENTITLYSKKSVGLKEGIALKAGENKNAKELVQKMHTQTWKSSKYGWIEVTGTDEQFLAYIEKLSENKNHDVIALALDCGLSIKKHN